MNNYRLTPIIYEYRYGHLPEDVRHKIIESRNSLFDRCTKDLGNVKRSNDFDTLITKLGIICGIAIIGYILSILI